MSNLNDFGRWIEDIKREIARLKSGAFLERASITNGRLRIIGGTLLVDSGGLVQIVGTLQVDGTTTVTGTFTVSGPVDIIGTFQVSGPWTFTGAGEITGDYTVTGKVTQVGDMDIDGVLTVNGDGWSITGDGEISGRVNLTGSFEVATGGYIRVGPVRISGASEGFISSLLAIVFNTPEMRMTGSARVEQSLVVDGGVTMPGLIPIAAADADPHVVGAVIRDASNRLRVVVD